MVVIYGRPACGWCDQAIAICKQYRIEYEYKSIRNEDFKNEPDHQLFRQMTRLTRDKGSLRHDDAIDALAMAAKYWVDRIDRDQTLSYNQHKEELLDQELERFMENNIGRKQSKDRWI